MGRRVVRLIVVLFLALAIEGFISVYAEEANPVNTTDQSHPLVKMLEAQYDAYREAERRGDVEAYKKTRTAEGIAFMEAHLKKLNKLDEFAKMIQQTPSYDYRDFQFLSCDAAAQTVRLSYRRNSEFKDASGQPRVEFLVVMFHLEDGVWKIGYLGHIGSQKFKEGQSAPVTLQEALQGMASSEKFRLPSE